jgi:hypothetical protein
MAKKNKKKDRKGSDAADAVEAVRSAVERTFQATTEGAAGTQKRTRALVEEVAHAAARIRETIEELRVLEDVRGLRREIESLARRVATLESRLGGKASPPSRPAPVKPSSRPAKRASAKPKATATAKPTAKAKAKAQPSPRAKAAKAKPAQSS